MNLDLGTLLSKGFTRIAGDFTAYLVALMVISGLTMALLQAMKEMTPLRKVYNRWRMQLWLCARAAGGKNVAQEAEKELLRLAVDGDESAFYSAELDALCAQFSSAAQLVIDYPDLSRELFLLLAHNGSEADVKVLLNEKMPYPLPSSLTEHQAPEKLRELAENRQKIIDARNRIRHQITQSIASFQMSSSAHWKTSLQSASWVVSFVLVLTASSLANAHAFDNKMTVLITAALAGFLAPIARDLLAALQSLRP